MIGIKQTRARSVTEKDVQALMKRCQIGVGGRNALDDAHSLMAECYGTLGNLLKQLSALRAVKHGLLVPFTVTAPCGEQCNCVEYHGRDGFAGGVVCYRKSTLLKGMP